MRCCICYETISGSYGHNAQPIAPGRCCEVCNREIVLPARFKQIARNNGDN
jgi:hypothetical protein